MAARHERLGAPTDLAGRNPRHLGRAERAARGCLRALPEDQELPLAHERAAFPRLPPAAGRTGDQIFAMTDPIAERVRKLGGMTLRSIGEIRAAAHRGQRRRLRRPERHAGGAAGQQPQLTRSCGEVHDICDEYGDVATASLLEVWIDETERRTWFLFRNDAEPRARQQLIGHTAAAASSLPVT